MKLSLISLIASAVSQISARNHFISTTGNDANSGLSSTRPVLTVERAMSLVAQSPDATNILYMAAGTYLPETHLMPSSPDGTFLATGSYQIRVTAAHKGLTIQGTGYKANPTIIMGAVKFFENSTNAVLRNVRVQNPQAMCIINKGVNNKVLFSHLYRCNGNGVGDFGSLNEYKYNLVEENGVNYNFALASGTCTRTSVAGCINGDGFQLNGLKTVVYRNVIRRNGDVGNIFEHGIYTSPTANDYDIQSNLFDENGLDAVKLNNKGRFSFNNITSSHLGINFELANGQVLIQGNHLSSLGHPTIGPALYNFAQIEKGFGFYSWTNATQNCYENPNLPFKQITNVVYNTVTKRNQSTAAILTLPQWQAAGFDTTSRSTGCFTKAQMLANDPLILAGSSIY